MSDERKDRHSLDAEFPGEDQLSRLYRDGSNDLPPADLDAVILDAARQAVHARPRRVYSFPSRKWLVPLSLAAALWVTLEFVLERQTEMRNPRLSAPSSSTLQLQDSDVKPQEADELVSIPPPAPLAPMPLEEKKLTQRKPLEPQAKQALQARERIPEAHETRSRRGIGPLSPAPRMQAAQPLRQLPRGQRESAAEEADTAAEAMEFQAGAASEQSAPSASAKQEKPVGELAAPTSAPALLSDAPTVAGASATEARKEHAFSPKEWLAKIKELRRTGKTAEAEASLKAFKQQYPDYPVEKFLQEQSEALQTPKE